MINTENWINSLRHISCNGQISIMNVSIYPNAIVFYCNHCHTEIHYLEICIIKQ